MGSVSNMQKLLTPSLPHHSSLHIVSIQSINNKDKEVHYNKGHNEHDNIEQRVTVELQIGFPVISE
jgi:hypothetical protein